MKLDHLVLLVKEAALDQEVNRELQGSQGNGEKLVLQDQLEVVDNQDPVDQLDLEVSLDHQVQQDHLDHVERLDLLEPLDLQVRLAHQDQLDQGGNEVKVANQEHQVSSYILNNFICILIAATGNTRVDNS